MDSGAVHSSVDHMFKGIHKTEWAKTVTPAVTNDCGRPWDDIVGDAKKVYPGARV